VSEATQKMLRGLLAQQYDNLKLRLSRRLGSSELASDALQETYLRLERADVRDSVKSPTAYLFRMAFNAALDKQRSEKRRFISREIEALVGIPDDAPGPAKILEDRDEVQTLVRAIQELPSRRRVILLAARLEGMQQKDIAKRLGVSLRLVEKELRLAQEYCAKKIKDGSCG
jgi:RNA polymerase sigma factor (sigma-70 family)